MRVFEYDRDLIEAFPDLVCGFVHATGLCNGPATDGFASEYSRAQRDRADELQAVDLSEVSTLAAWRSVFRRCGVNPTRTRSAAEALLRRLKSKGWVPSINLLTDIGNHVSMRFGLPVAVFDVQDLCWPVRAVFVDGSETFKAREEDEPVPPEPGEVGFVDAEARVIARRWCWRQGVEGLVRANTGEIFGTVEGHHESARRDVALAVAELASLLERHARGRTRTWILNRTHTGVDLDPEGS